MIELIKNNDNNILKNLYYDLFYSYNIKIKKEYQFVYDDFFYHLILDTNNYVSKNYNKEKHINLLDYKKGIFKGLFYKHYSQPYYYYKILEPEKDIEINKELRKRKLKKIENW